MSVLTKCFVVLASYPYDDDEVIDRVFLNRKSAIDYMDEKTKESMKLEEEGESFYWYRWTIKDLEIE